MSHLYGAIEAGGTKFLCAVGSGPQDLSEVVRIDTRDPLRTIAAAIAALKRLEDEHGKLAAIGIASFGPVDVHVGSPHFGTILATPKPGWSHTEIAAPIAAALGVPVGLDTDVNGALLGEHRWGAAEGCDAAAYVTVGTGLGAGLMVNGLPVHGVRHPEIGHITPPRHPDDGEFVGTCPFHGGCLEGLVSGPAIQKRWGKSLSHLPADHPAHEIVAWYLGHLAASLVAMVSPERIIFGGGVMHAPGLIERIRARALEFDRAYSMSPALVRQQIVLPGLGDNAGILGGLVLAEKAHTATL